MAAARRERIRSRSLLAAAAPTAQRRVARWAAAAAGVGLNRQRAHFRPPAAAACRFQGELKLVNALELEPIAETRIELSPQLPLSLSLGHQMRVEQRARPA